MINYLVGSCHVPNLGLFCELNSQIKEYDMTILLDFSQECKVTYF